MSVMGATDTVQGVTVAPVSVEHIWAGKHLSGHLWKTLMLILSYFPFSLSVLKSTLAKKVILGGSRSSGESSQRCRL